MLRTTPRLLFALAVAGTGLAAAVPSAEAAYPGTAGKIVFVEKHFEFPISRLVVANADGTEQQPITDFSDHVHNPVWSPDGTRIAYQWREHAEDDFDIKVHDITTGESETVAGFEGDQVDPTWSPDGTSVAYEDGGDIDKVRADGTSTEAETVFADEGDAFQPAWSSTNMLAFVVYETEHRDIYAVPAGGGDVVEITDGTSDDSHPDWSPDGTKIVYESDGTLAMHELGAAQGEPYDPTAALDTSPVFSPDGARVLWASDRDMGDGWGTRLWSGTSDPDAPAPAPIDLGETTYVDDPDWQPLGGKKPDEPKKEDPKVDPPITQPAGPAPAPAPVVTAPRATKAASRQCASKRVFQIRVKRSRGDVVTKAKVVVNGKAVKVRKLDRLYATVDLRKLPRGSWDVEITATMKGGKVTKDVRRYKTCAPKPKRKRA